MECVLSETSADNVRLHVILYHKFKTYQKFLIDVDENICNFHTKKNNESSIILNIIMPFIKNHTNIFHPCPYFDLVYIRNLDFSKLVVVNAPLPTGQYRFDIDIYDSEKNKSMLFSQLFITIPRGLTVDDFTLG